MDNIDEFLGRISRGEDITHDDIEISTTDIKYEYELPREPRFYKTEKIGGFPYIGSHIPMPNVKPHKSVNGDRICNTCSKRDVCMYKGELQKAIKDITQISGRTNVFMDVNIRCKKWFENLEVSNEFSRRFEKKHL